MTERIVDKLAPFQLAKRDKVDVLIHTHLDIVVIDRGEYEMFAYSDKDWRKLLRTARNRMDSKFALNVIGI